MRGGYRIDLQPMVGNAPRLSSGTQGFALPGVTIHSNEPMIRLGDQGYVIGHLFTRGPPSRRIGELDRTALARIEASAGRALLSDYWGGYVMVLTDSEGRVRILRDPSGAVPCYVRRDASGISLSSDIDALVQPGPATPDFEEIARLLASKDAPGRQCCVAGVEELIGGECLMIDHGDAVIESWWSPWDHVQSRVPGFDEAAAQLSETIVDCVGAWARCFGSIMLGVSGGLDSSIVAAAASPRAPGLVCATFVGPDVDGDERRYARALAESLGVTLHEKYLDLADIDIARPPAPHHPWPNAYHFKQAVEAIHRRIEQTRAIDAYFSGNGGDGVFCSMYSASPFLDRFLAEGPRPTLAATLRDVCGVTGADATTVLRHSWTRYRSDGGRHRPRHDLTGLTDDAGARIERAGPLHPWLAAPSDALPGKTSHVAFLMRAHRSLELYPRASSPPHVAPLLAQPIVELCLSIPSWFWIDGGINRAVARAAFEGMLPPAILRRVHKGGPGGFSLSIYRRHRADLHALLRDGRLAAAGVFDPAFLDRPEDPSWRGAERVQRILEFAAAESWARAWSGDQPQRG